VATLSKFNLLMKQLYRSKLKSKSFILMTCLYILGMSVAIFWSDIKELFTGNDQAKQIAIVNETTADLSGLFVSNGDMEFIQNENNLSKLEKKVKDEKLDAIVKITGHNDVVL